MFTPGHGTSIHKNLFRRLVQQLRSIAAAAAVSAAAAAAAAAARHLNASIYGASCLRTAAARNRNAAIVGLCDDYARICHATASGTHRCRLEWHQMAAGLHRVVSNVDRGRGVDAPEGEQREEA